MSQYGPGISGAGRHYSHSPDNPITRDSPNLNFPFRFFESRDGALWVIGYEAEPVKIIPSPGLALQNMASGSGARLMQDDTVVCLLEDHEGSIWMGARSGEVIRYEPETGLYSRIRSAKDHTVDLDTYFTCSLEEDASAGIWMGMEVGGSLEQYDKKTGYITTFWPSLKAENDPRPWADNTVNEIIEDRAGRLWIGANYGIARFTPYAASDPFELYDRSRVISNIFEGFSEGLLFGTETTGLKYLDADNPWIPLRFVRRSARKRIMQPLSFQNWGRCHLPG